jgi:catechol 2,3-dioxygenase-like lactoylglutathione lyase family enzyme
VERSRRAARGVGGLAVAQSKIRHIAIRTENTRGLADFYMNTFGMIQVIARAATPGGPPEEKRAVYLSDGYINLAILPANGEPEGIDHFGFLVDDIEATGRVGKDAGAQTGIAPRPRDGRYAEFRLHDPVGTGVDLSEAGWATEPETLEVFAGRAQ